MEPTDSRPTAILPPGLDSPTDPLICGLLAVEPMTSPALAARLAIPARTVRPRLMRLRDAGAVTVGEDGMYRVASLAVEALPTLAAPGAGLAAPRAVPTIGKKATGLAVVGALASCCLAAVIWVAKRNAGRQKPSPMTSGTPLPPASPPWPYGASWL